MMRYLILLLVLFCHPLLAHPVELVLWHGMAGHLGDEVRQLADGFNKSQSDYVVTAVYKGDYVETFTSFAAAYRAKKAPNMVQIFEVGTALMLNPQGIIKPVDELMREHQLILPKEDFIQSVREFYSQNGQLMALPFNLSAPVLYYNQDALAKAGFDHEHFPKTWIEMEALAKVLSAKGYDCVYTTAYPGWVLFESFLAIHGLPLVADKPSRAVYDSKALVRHFERLKRWQEMHYLRYGGRGDDASVLFLSGVCPLFSQSSGAYNSLKQLVPFKLGMSVMPLDTQVSTTRHPNVAGGAALWAVSGQSSKEYLGIAHFFSYLARVDTQQRWHEQTGYLPIGLKGVYAPILNTSTHPALLLAKGDLENSSEQTITHSHSAPQNQIRNMNDEIFEAMFSGGLTAEEAMKQSIQRANHILLRFARNTQAQQPQTPKHNG